MNQTKAKKISKLAKELATHSNKYLVKTTTKIYNDFTDQPLPYTVDQTVLHPNSEKSIKSFLKKLDKEGVDVFDSNVNTTDLLALESTAKLSELAAKGYQLQH